MKALTHTIIALRANYGNESHESPNTNTRVRQNSSSGRGVPPGRPDASAMASLPHLRRILSHTPLTPRLEIFVEI
jgi:hypothetical protein